MKYRRINEKEEKIDRSGCSDSKDRPSGNDWIAEIDIIN